MIFAASHGFLKPDFFRVERFLVNFNSILIYDGSKQNNKPVYLVLIHYYHS